MFRTPIQTKDKERDKNPNKLLIVQSSHENEWKQKIMHK
jgi:hypothetical protein